MSASEFSREMLINRITCLLNILQTYLTAERARSDLRELQSRLMQRGHLCDLLDLVKLYLLIQGLVASMPLLPRDKLTSVCVEYLFHPELHMELTVDASVLTSRTEINQGSKKVFTWCWLEIGVEEISFVLYVERGKVVLRGRDIEKRRDILLKMRDVLQFLSFYTLYVQQEYHKLVKAVPKSRYLRQNITLKLVLDKVYKPLCSFPRLVKRLLERYCRH